MSFNLNTPAFVPTTAFVPTNTMKIESTVFEPKMFEDLPKFKVNAPIFVPSFQALPKC
jgi:hypothetical protein